MKARALALLPLAVLAAACGDQLPSGDPPRSRDTSANPAATPEWLYQLDQRFPKTTDATHTSIRREAGALVTRVEDHRSRPPLGIVLPNDATESVELRARGGELGLRFRLLGATSAGARVLGDRVLEDKVVYENAGPSRADVAFRVGPRGVEDFLHFSAPTRQTEVSYEVALDHVSAVRLVSNTVEYLDDAGAPRLRTTRPVLRDAHGRKRFATTSLSGCAYDTDPRAPWGRPLVDPGSEHCQLTIRWDASGLEHPVILDPGWVATDDLADARSFHTATLLDSGKVLVTGGQQDGTPLASTEVYDLETETWSMVEDLARARYLHTATKLVDGTVIVLGGYGEDQSKLSLSESFSEQWITVSPMPEARAEHTATWIPNDTIVVIGGGGTRALVFDPNLGEWTPKGTAQTDRYGHAAVNTGDDVLVIGGSSTPLPAEDAMKSVEIFDVSTGEFTSQPAMRYGRHGHTATVLDNGRVLVVGKARNAEIYDTFTDQWSVTATPPTAGRSYHAAVELQSDELGAQVLFVGGLFGNTTYDSSEFFVPNGERWTRLDLRMNSKRFAHQATALTPGMVLLTGGQEGFGDPLAVTELVTFIEPGEPCETAGECFTGHCVDGVCCESACDGGCQACSERRGSSADGACDVLGEGIDCWAGVDTCEVKSSCDGVSPTCDVSEFPTDGATCNDGLDETGNDRCQQGTCRGTRRVEPPPPGGAAGTGGEPGSGGTGGSAGGGGTAGTGGGSGGAPPERDDATEAVPTPLSCSVGRSAPAGEPVGSAGWWMLFGLILGTRRERGRYK